MVVSPSMSWNKQVFLQKIWKIALIPVSCRVKILIKHFFSAVRTSLWGLVSPFFGRSLVDYRLTEPRKKEAFSNHFFHLKPKCFVQIETIQNKGGVSRLSPLPKKGCPISHKHDLIGQPRILR